MEEVFQESEVFWSDHHHHRRGDDAQSSIDHDDEDSSDHSRQPWRKKVMKTSSSVPVTIPETTATGRSWLHFQDSDEDGNGEMVPPHLLVARRLEGKMAFSVCTGKGRTLKGRDLKQVRNSILRLTGFIES
ncbi:PREDICTED: uncharacterized protein LOC104608402 [Nelumbo nucifera]|uniref:Uncharacterized protein LOC104608402 n=2 Tax=Nelumbo nucifera TaxID=4432 RepID=A0A1U8AX99_NELNU|nr:PREDICTED: uncharacterized protein LOC104608402 [Nelumbo nucifera]DAD48129.1 TPA_asm: hypothetical protein HUJ06_018066 [Nelumbo nucifera]